MLLHHMSIITDDGQPQVVILYCLINLCYEQDESAFVGSFNCNMYGE